LARLGDLGAPMVKRNAFHRRKRDLADAPRRARRRVHPSRDFKARQTFMFDGRASGRQDFVKGWARFFIFRARPRCFSGGRTRVYGRAGPACCWEPTVTVPEACEGGNGRGIDHVTGIIHAGLGACLAVSRWMTGRAAVSTGESMGEVLVKKQVTALPPRAGRGSTGDPAEASRQGSLCDALARAGGRCPGFRRTMGGVQTPSARRSSIPRRILRGAPPIRSGRARVRPRSGGGP